MEDKFTEENSMPQNDVNEEKDRRRFLKQMAACAVAAPLITVLPQMAAALSSGVGMPTSGSNSCGPTTDSSSSLTGRRFGRSGPHGNPSGSGNSIADGGTNNNRQHRHR